MVFILEKYWTLYIWSVLHRFLPTKRQNSYDVFGGLFLMAQAYNIHIAYDGQCIIEGYWIL